MNFEIIELSMTEFEKMDGELTYLSLCFNSENFPPRNRCQGYKPLTGLQALSSFTGFIC